MNNTLNRYSRINIETSMGLVLQRTHIGFPASLWVLTIPCHSRSEGSDSTMWSLRYCTHLVYINTQTKPLCTTAWHKKMFKKYFN